ncbi:class I SAM-dependent DNA methyltransferase [Roseomonas sp. CCTCC AB2023176]|uniref:class I SAM-dependent DNA methyltransferase n=1 Tax=Roseomonas sp. CCTCC AB2023176 TaxID=3342640 RepID=UPI0035D8E980
MDPGTFVETWRANTRPEAAGAKAHFSDLCDLLRVPKPQTDATGSGYAFEKLVAKADGRPGFADVWKRECFGWEYKSRGGDLDAAHAQLLRYAGNLGNPPLLVVSDMARIIVRTAWTNEVTEAHAFDLDDLYKPDVRARLREMWTPPPLAWKPAQTRQALTEEAAGRFAELAHRLRLRGHDPAEVAHFMVRLAFCFFAHDTGLLDRDLLPKLLQRGCAAPDRFAALAGRLFAAMGQRGGELDFTAVPWFNGGLFDDARALPLAAGDAAMLSDLTDLRWRDMDPAIMGTLFERGLDPEKRGQLGAHYTDRATIERIMDPVVRRPLAAEWEAAKARITALMEERRALRAEAGAGGAEALAELAGLTGTALAAKRKVLAREADRRRKRAEAAAEEAGAIFAAHLARLRDFRVLDAACGGGNFLYVALQTLKDLEGRVLAEGAALGLPPRFPEVGPEAVLGIELNPYAAELARVSVWIGHIQWALRNGYPAPSDPVLRTLDTIECRDAILAADTDGRPMPAAWPRADAILGNPPFIGGKMLRRQLGDPFVDRLFAAYAGRVPAEADLVCYWFDKAREAVAAGGTARVGLVSTNSIRGGANREVLDRFTRAAPITEAWSDEPWVLDGAAVRVSIVCAAREAEGTPRLDGREVPAIFADLTAGGVDLTRASRLTANAGVCFMGTTKVGPFDVSAEVARTWLREPPNANGRPNADVVRPWRNGLHILRRADDAWVVDFGATMSEAEAAFYALPFAHVALTVKPTRKPDNRDRALVAWWRHGRPRPDMRTALRDLSRYIVTPAVAKHRIFAWLDARVVPDHQLLVFARDDDATFGILHSRFHEAWAIRMGSWMGAGNDPRYTPTTTFETFPFPDGLTPDVPAATSTGDPRARRIAEAARTLVEARDRWLNPEGMVERVAEVVPGFPDRIVPRSLAAATTLRKRTLTALYNARGTPEGAWLDALHRDLDAAVAEAYGWPTDLSTEDALARLLALNQARVRAS